MQVLQAVNDKAAKKSNKKAKKQKGGSCSCRRLSSADGFTVSKVAGSVPGG